MSNILHNFINTLPPYILYIFSIASIFWIVHIVNFFTHFKLNNYGIAPRKIESIPGIIFSPFLHANFKHLLFNSSYFIIFSMLLCYSYSFTTYIYASVAIIIICGSLIWIFARGNAVHIGLSGVIIGYLGFLVSIAYFDPSSLSFSISAIALLLGFHLISTIIPNNTKTSWEGHLFGVVSGILVSYLFYLLRIASINL